MEKLVQDLKFKCRNLDSISQTLSGEIQVQWTWLRPVHPRPVMPAVLSGHPSFPPPSRNSKMDPRYKLRG